MLSRAGAAGPGRYRAPARHAPASTTSTADELSTRPTAPYPNRSAHQPHAASTAPASTLPATRRCLPLITTAHPPATDRTFPSEARELAAVGRYLGYAEGTVGELPDDYRRITRRARAVVDDLFYGA
ncbi:hypothetical protein Slala03_81460 [Streptomyces lavendulae subsp. lavendulae]|uniref:hypothetical protein n=1 Tax=Streptomyces lavendulae TaxID=1914 RepID=UPI0024A1D701|nr:hypothetical protein [Streptomyces lavendulae]GLV88457.1 hypothetical protein Slala03_81460 [Streptomyces lavendulae subsp. lavendulae]